MHMDEHFQLSAKSARAFACICKMGEGKSSERTIYMCIYQLCIH